MCKFGLLPADCYRRAVTGGSHDELYLLTESVTNGWRFVDSAQQKRCLHAAQRLDSAQRQESRSGRHNDEVEAEARLDWASDSADNSAGIETDLCERGSNGACKISAFSTGTVEISGYLQKSEKNGVTGFPNYQFFRGIDHRS